MLKGVVSVVTTISSAYLEFLERYLKERSLVMCVRIEKPIKNGELNLDPEIDRAFRDFTFPPTGKEKVGKTGDWWISNRMNALLDERGEYYPRLHRNRQYEKVLSSLQDYQRQTWNANCYVLVLFDPASDLHCSKTNPTIITRMPKPPCLTMLQFLPRINKLSLYAHFRAQYIDTKAYGNILSLAELLQRVCSQTGFEVGSLHNVASKLIARHNAKTVRKLHRRLKRS